MRFRKGVIHLCQNRAESFLLVVAIEKRDRVEVVAAITEMSKQKNFSFGRLDTFLAGIECHASTKVGMRITEMVAFAIRNNIAAVVAGEP